MPDQIDLSVDNVQRILLACCFKEQEQSLGYVCVFSALSTFKFHPKRLDENRSNIRAMLAQFPPPFMNPPGWNYHHAIYRADGTRWARHHETVDGICALGIGVGAVTFAPDQREHWSSLPGGLPYIIVTL